jgi:NADH dehydrogenase
MAASEGEGRSLPRVVIIGGGFAGLTAARALRNAPVSVTLVDRTNHHLFQPLLYQVATAALSPAEIAAPIRSILHGQKNLRVFMAEVHAVDAEARVVHAGGFSLPYDYLIAAPGARYNYFAHPEWEAIAPSLKSIPDATTLRHKILMAFEAAEIEQDPARREALLTFVLVGGGPTGVEMAGSMAELAHWALNAEFDHIDPRATRILLMEAGDRILDGFPPELSAAAHRELERKGVEVRLGSRVQSVDPEGVVVNGERIPSPTVIWTAGIVANPVAKWLGAEADRIGRVLVRPDLSVPGLSDVFVLGDAAHVQHNGKPLPGIAPVAMQQGRYAAALIRARLAGQLDHPPFRYVDKGNLATVGRGFAIAEVRGRKMKGLLAWWVWIFVHIWYLIGFRNRVAVLLQWAWAYVTFQRGARLITQDAPEAPAGTGTTEQVRDRTAA